MTLAALTQSQLEVLEQLAKGKTNAEIADSLFKSEDTIKCHVRSLLKIFHCDNRTHLVAMFYQSELLKLKRLNMKLTDVLVDA